MKTWEFNAEIAEQVYGCLVDWDERFYHCPECGEPIYECDWSDVELCGHLCPICGFEMEEE